MLKISQKGDEITAQTQHKPPHDLFPINGISYFILTNDGNVLPHENGIQNQQCKSYIHCHIHFFNRIQHQNLYQL